MQEDQKKTLITEILNVGYLPKKEKEFRGKAYLIMADITAGYFEASESAHPEIVKEFYLFIKSNYPEQFKNSVRAKDF